MMPSWFKMQSNSDNPAALLASLRPKKEFTCPLCGDVRLAVISRTQGDVCIKCRSRLLMRERKKLKQQKGN